MKLKMKSDRDFGNVFWNGPNGEVLCQLSAAKLIDIDEVEAIYIMTAPKVPARAKDGAFGLHGRKHVVDAGRLARSLDSDLKAWLRKAYESGDRYAWIEY